MRLPPARVAIAALGAAGTPAAVVRSRGRGGGGGVARQRRSACAGLTEPVRALSDDGCVRTAAGFSGGFATCCTPTPAPTPATNRAAPAAALPQPLASWSENIGRCAANDGGAAARGRRRRVGAAPEAFEDRERQQAGDARGDPLAHGRAREQPAVQPGGQRLAPAAAGSARGGGRGGACRACPAGVSAAVTMIPWMRRQRAPETMSSNSSRQPPAGAEQRRLDGRAGSCPSGGRSPRRRAPRARAGRGSRGGSRRARRTRRTGCRGPAWPRPRRPATGSELTSREWSAGARPSSAS